MAYPDWKIRCSQSTLVQGWDNVLRHIDEALGCKDEASVFGPCCELHDAEHGQLSLWQDECEGMCGV